MKLKRSARIALRRGVEQHLTCHKEVKRKVKSLEVKLPNLP